MTEEVIEKAGESPEAVQETQETKTEVPETPEELQGRLTVMEKERDSALEQAQNAQGLIGQHTNELNQLRNDNAYFRQQGQQTQQHPQNPETGSPAGSAEEEYDMYDPLSVKRLFAAEKKKMLDVQNEGFRQFATYQQQQQVGSSFSRGKQVIQNDPGYFKGVEEETSTMVSNLAASGAIRADLIEDPTTWYGCADMVKGKKGREGQPKIDPVTATAMDTPSSIKSNDDDDIGGEEIPKDIIDTFYDGDEKKAIEGMRNEAKARKARGGM